MSFYVAQVSQQLSSTDSTSHDNEIVILRSKNGVQQGEELHAAFENKKRRAKIKPNRNLRKSLSLGNAESVSHSVEETSST